MYWEADRQEGVVFGLKVGAEKDHRKEEIWGHTKASTEGRVGGVAPSNRLIQVWERKRKR